jgi:HME family heavy-metal exporter
MDGIRRRLGVIPGGFSITQPINMRLNENVLTGSTADIVIKIFGDDLDTLRTIAGQVEGRLARVAGVADVAIEAQMPVPQLLVQVDPRRTLLYGLKPGELSRTLEHMTNGIVVAQAVDGIRRFDVVIRLPEWQRSMAELGTLMIETPAGDVPLSQIATVTETNGPNEVLRENGQRRILVTANGNGTNSNMIPQEVARIMTEVAVPTGYFMVFEGVYAEESRSTLRLAALGLVSMMLIFAILFTRYRSPVFALIVMGNVPLALVGSVIAMKLASVDLSVASMIGFITLTGISTRNGILRVSHYINLVLHEGESFGRALILRGGLERLSPVLMTATSAGVALIPLLLDAHGAGKEILHPVAVVIFGGLISATLLDALVTPLLFYRFGLKPLHRLVAMQEGGRPVEAY